MLKNKASERFTMGVLLGDVLQIEQHLRGQGDGEAAGKPAARNASPSRARRTPIHASVAATA